MIEEAKNKLLLRLHSPKQSNRNVIPDPSFHSWHWLNCQQWLILYSIRLILIRNIIYFR